MEKLDYKLDTLGQGVLKIVKNNSAMQDAVIAGGYIRDSICKKPFKDIDIFLPFTPHYNIGKYLDSLPADFKHIDTKVEIFGEATRNYSMAFKVYDLTYLESIPIQIIVTSFPKTRFTNTLLDSFDYGICQVYAEDENVYGTEAFNYDVRSGTATLLNLNRVNELPKHMKRFERLREKYPHLIFRCPELSITTKRDEEKNKKLSEMYGLQVPPVTESLGNWTGGVTPATAPQPVLPPSMYTVSELLAFTVADITKANSQLNWDILETMNNSTLAVAHHADTLIQQWDEIHGIDDELPDEVEDE